MSVQGGGIVDPFSSDKESVASDRPSKVPPQTGVHVSKPSSSSESLLGLTTVASEEEGHQAVAEEASGEGTEASKSSSTPDGPVTGLVGGEAIVPLATSSDGGNSSSVKEFCFSGDDGDDDSERDAAIATGSGGGGDGANNSMRGAGQAGTTNDAGRGVGAGTGAGELERGSTGGNAAGTVFDSDREEDNHRHRRFPSEENSESNNSSVNNASEDNKRESEGTRRCSNKLLNVQDGRCGDGSEDEKEEATSELLVKEGGNKGKVLSPSRITPAPGAWAPPDFGFSSDEDFDLEISSLDVSSSKTAESGAGDNSERISPLSSSPMAGSNIYEFDSTSAES